MSLVEAADLHYVTDSDPGILRRRAGKGFTYQDSEGRRVTDPATLRWIKSLAIPPAWTQVWICSSPDGHLLASGRDAKGRKQYRYHPRWRAVQEATKFERMLSFGKILPELRRQVERDLARAQLDRRKVTALVVRLLETTLIRVGNAEYARLNKSFGITTMRDRHLEVQGSTLKFRFRGKSGKQHEVTVKSRRLARLAQQCQDIKGQELFQYLDEDGERRRISSEDVNGYLREVTGEEFTAKDFRTWSGTVLAAWALREFEAFDSQAAGKRNVTRAIEAVASRLGNTPAICRKSYVHPVIVEAYLDGTLLEHLRDQVEQELREDLSGLTAEEAVVLTFLRNRLEEAVEGVKEEAAAAA